VKRESPSSTRPKPNVSWALDERGEAPDAELLDRLRLLTEAIRPYLVRGGTP